MIGTFITFEGIEGAGKTTQVKRLYDELFERMPNNVIMTREPGGSYFGNTVRGLLFNKNTCSRAELMLFLAERAQHIHDVVRPALAKGQVIICDRFTDTTVAIQHHVRGLDLSLINSLNYFVTEEVRPHRTYLLDLEPQEGLRRIYSQDDREITKFDELKVEQHILERRAYLSLARIESSRIRIVDASQSVNEIAEQIFYGTLDVINERRRHE
jgi:dTMP kinase